MVETMRPGSVVVDLAAESGGNCELSQPGVRTSTMAACSCHGRQGRAVGDAGAREPALLPATWSNLLLLMTAEGQVVPDFADEIVGCRLRDPGKPTADVV